MINMEKWYGINFSNNMDDEAASHEVASAEITPELKSPSMYQVVLLNDDYTPMDFVVGVLIVFFNMNEEQANQVMLRVHTTGKAVCGVYTRDIAETKAAIVNEYARESGHPLLCEIESV